MVGLLLFGGVLKVVLLIFELFCVCVKILFFFELLLKLRVWKFFVFLLNLCGYR